MPLIYITGDSGTGKSSCLALLAQKGFEVHDSDEDGSTAWYDKQTGKKVLPPTRIVDRTEDWYANHVWKLSRTRVEALAKHAQHKPVFLCGSTLSDTEVWDLFEKVICLTIDEGTLKQRLLTRTNSDWGKAPDELKHVLAWRERWERLNRDRGAIMVDATQSLETVVGEILRAVNGGLQGRT